MRLSKSQGVFLTGVAALAVVTGMGANARDIGKSNGARLQRSSETQQAVDAARGLSKAFREVSNAILPSVVAIETSPHRQASQPREDGVPDAFRGQNPFQGTPFEEMFRGRQFELPQAERTPRPRAGIGSGVIIDSTGIILTNNHVVRGGEVTVRLHDGREFQAVDVFTDPKTDIAVVKIESATGLVAAPLGDSEAVEIGDWVLALGQPYGLESTVTAGIISAKHRGIGIAARENFLQTDAAINPGNSGGPLVNLAGEVIGINTAISSRSGGNDGIGFSVPVNLAKWVADQLVEEGTVRRAYLGVGIQPVTQELAARLGVKPRQGVVVTDVYPGTPAAQTGLQPGDVIVEFAGQSVESPQALQLLVERAKLGETHSLRIMRDGKAMSLGFTSAAQPSDFDRREARRPNVEERSSRFDSLGMQISPLTDDVARKLGAEGVRGVVITAVKPGSRAARAGLKSGMVITQVNGQTVSAVDKVESLLSQSDDDGVLLLVRTANGSRFVVLNG